MGFDLNVMCDADRGLWQCIVPMIYVYGVEWHLPHRVAMQFGIYQHTPPGQPTDTGPRAPPVSALFSMHMISLRADFIVMFLVAYALQDEPEQESGYHKLGRGT